MNTNLNRQSSTESKKDAVDVVFSALSDILFEKVNLLNNPSLITSTSVTSILTYGMLLRVPDTSKGRYLRPDKVSRIRLLFYYSSNQSKTIGYILSPCVYSLDTAPDQVDSLESFVGIKIDLGTVYLVSKVNDKEILKKTKIKITDDSTYKLDIRYNINSADIYIDNELLGTMECKMDDSINNLQTFYPLIAPIKSSDGSPVQINIENYQFLQDR